MGEFMVRFQVVRTGGFETGRETEPVSGPADGDYVQFWTTGDSVKGEFRCSECGYGVAVCRDLPVCPMCAGKTWEQADWSPFARAQEELR
jgi:rubredoxin